MKTPTSDEAAGAQSAHSWSDAAVDGPTRQKIMHLLLTQGPLTAQDLADELDLTTVAVRRHLTSLTDAGDIAPQDHEGPKRRGRPAKEYVLTPQGRHEFGDAYDALAIQVMSELVAVAGPDAIGRLAEQRLSEVEGAYRRRRGEDPDADPVELLAETLNDAGYFASALEDGELCQHHCPVSHVAAHFPALCEAETRIFSRMLGSSLERTASIAHGDAACRVHVEGPTPLPDPRSSTHDGKASV